MFSHILKLIEELFENSFGLRIYIHGTILHKCLTAEKINKNDILQVFCPTVKNGDISQLINNLSYNLKIIKKYRILDIKDINSTIPNVIVCETNINQINIIIEFHVEDKNKFLFDSDNVILTKNGLTKWNNSTEFKFTSLDLVKTIRNISIKTCEYISDYNSISNDPFELMIHQNKKINDGYKVENALKNTKNKELCSICCRFEFLYILKCHDEHKFCSTCLDKNKCSFELSNRNSCPFCRKKICF